MINFYSMCFNRSNTVSIMVLQNISELFIKTICLLIYYFMVLMVTFVEQLMGVYGETES